MTNRAFCLIALALLNLAGCEKTKQAKIDACSLLTKEEVAAVQGATVTEAKSSAQANGGFRTAQCFYTAKEFSKSVVLTVTQSDPDASDGRTPKSFWNDTFHREGKSEKEEEEHEKQKGGEREGEEEERAKPVKIEGVGDESFWTGARFGGALYALKKNFFIRISVGGGDTEQGKIDHSKALAVKALGRL
jgi:hypothetical protein